MVHWKYLVHLSAIINHQNTIYCFLNAKTRWKGGGGELTQLCRWEFPYWYLCMEKRGWHRMQGSMQPCKEWNLGKTCLVLEQTGIRSLVNLSQCGNNFGIACEHTHTPLPIALTHNSLSFVTHFVTTLKNLRHLAVEMSLWQHLRVCPHVHVCGCWFSIMNFSYYVLTLFKIYYLAKLLYLLLFLIWSTYEKGLSWYYVTFEKQ